MFSRARGGGSQPTEYRTRHHFTSACGKRGRLISFVLMGPRGVDVDISILQMGKQAQRSYAVYPKSHSKEVAEGAVRPRLLCLTYSSSQGRHR